MARVSFKRLRAASRDRYTIELLKDTTEKVNDIRLKKNASLSKSEGVYSQELYNDLYRLTVFVADPLQTGEAASDMYPEELVLTGFVLFFVYRVKCGKWWNDAVIFIGIKYLIKSAVWLFAHLKRIFVWISAKLKKSVTVLTRGIRRLPVV